MTTLSARSTDGSSRSSKGVYVRSIVASHTGELPLTRSANAEKPLDCWKEVEAFKTEVAKLEQVSLHIEARGSTDP